MAQTKDQLRASDAVAAWMAHREWNNAQLVAATGADAGTVGDFLNGKRWPKTGTQGKIEKALGWAPGTLRAIALGGPAPDVTDSVGADQQDADGDGDSLLYRRPEGVSDNEWDRIKRESRGFIEWQIERAAQER